MHMPDILVSHPAVFGGCFAAAGTAVAMASRRLQRRFEQRSVPLMGVLGAFIFAAQMVNFAIPGFATSGHLGGAALLAALFGPAAAILVMTGVLIIQCLLFQDGGLLALGANILLMGVLPALVTAGCLRVTGRLIGGRLGALVGTGLGAWLGLLLAAGMVPVLAALSGSLPGTAALSTFLWLMLGLHALIGIGEVCISLAVLGFLGALRPDLVDAFRSEPAERVLPPRRARALLIGGGLALSVLISGGLSQLAASDPDGLESAMQQTGLAPTAAPVGAVQSGAQNLVATTAVMADYAQFPGLGSGRLAAMLAGVAGTFASFVLIWALARAFHRRSRPAAPPAA